MRAALTLSAAAVLAGLSLPAPAQLGLPPAPLGQDSGSGAPGYGADRLGRVGSNGAPLVERPAGMFFGGLGGQGFNPGRVGALDQGLRVTPPLLQGLPSAPQLGAPIEAVTIAPTGAYLGYRFDNLSISSAVRQGQGFGVPGSGPPRLDLGASYGFRLTGRQMITVSGNVTLGQTTAAGLYASAYGPDTLARWNYRLGEPGAGFRLSWQYSFDRNLYLSTTLGYDRTYGDPTEGFYGLGGGATSFGTVFGYRW